LRQVFLFLFIAAVEDNGISPQGSGGERNGYGAADAAEFFDNEA